MEYNKNESKEKQIDAQIAVGESAERVGVEQISLKPYYHLAKYYETDQMAVVHHSNYIRWFEEARVDYLEQIGLGFEKIEEAGMYSPVINVTCEFKSAVRFNETVMIITKLKLFDGIKMVIEYKVFDSITKQLRVSGESKHCFVTKDFKPVSLKKSFKSMYDVLLPWVGVEIII